MDRCYFYDGPGEGGTAYLTQNSINQMEKVYTDMKKEEMDSLIRRYRNLWKIQVTPEYVKKVDRLFQQIDHAFHDFRMQ